MHDAAPDVTDARTRGPITARVYGDGVDFPAGMPLAGAEVFFVEPDGTVTDVVTGLDGIATVIAPDNTTLWILHRDSSTIDFIETYEGAQIGDSLIGGDPTPPATDIVGGEEYFAFSALDGATPYYLTMSCSTGSPGSTSPIWANFVPCPQETTANAVLTGTDISGNFEYTSASAIDLTAHTSPSTALTLPQFRPGATIGVTFTNLPSSLGESQAALRAIYRSGADPTALQNVQVNESTSSDTMSASVSIAPVGDQTEVYGTVDVGRSAYAYTYDATMAGQQTSVMIDASTMVHPAKTWQYDAGTTSITWTQDAFGVDPTVVSSSLSWNAGPQVTWRVMAPYAGSAKLALPSIPPALADVIPSPSDAVFKQIDLTSYAGKSYHDVLVRQAGNATSWQIGVAP